MAGHSKWANIKHKARGSKGQSDALVMDQLISLISDSNQQIFEAGLREDRLKGMGTTIVAGLVIGDKLFYAHVGDSRLYRLRKGQLMQLTEDHTLLQEAKNGSLHGEMDLEATIPGNIVTRALGAGPKVEVDCAVTLLQLDDIYLSCSDGISDRLSDATIQQTIEASDASAPAIAHMIMLANEAGGEDNISAIMMRVSDRSLVGGLKRLFK